MTREQQNILHDLAHKLLNKVIDNVSDIHTLCKTINIPEVDSTKACVGALLFVTMDLMHHITPKLTAQGFADIALAQYTYYLKLENERIQRS